MPKTKEPPAKMTFGKDSFGKEILYKDDDLAVVMEWEKPYIESSIDALKPSGDVLEIGFGLGYAARKIQEFHPKSHTIIESNPEIVQIAQKWAKDFKNVKIIEGRWQEILPKLGLFNAVFFDDYTPYNRQELEQMVKNNVKLQQLTDEVETVRDELADLLRSYANYKFTDKDLEQFKKHLLSRPHLSLKQVTNFLSILAKQGNITPQQRDQFLKTIKNEQFQNDDSQMSILHQLNQKQIGKNFIEFAEEALNRHMRPDATLSGYIGPPNAASHEPAFQQKILSRKDISYTEKTIPVQVPKNCAYFQGKSALIIVLKKK